MKPSATPTTSASARPAHLLSEQAAPEPSAPKQPAPKQSTSEKSTCSERNKRTSQRVLELLKAQGAQCAAQLSEGLGITEQGVRRHLLRLTEDGLITTHTEKPLGRGRPQQFYQLTEQGEARFPKSYPTLCIEVLEQVEQEFGGKAVAKVLAGRAHAIKQRLSAQWPTDLTPVQRLERLTEELRAAGYASELERGEEAGTFYLTHHNCPHLAVAQEFGELCQAEQALIAELVGTPSTTRSEGRIVTGDCCCRYLLNLNAQPDGESA